jgi:hypothetical protein
VENTRLMNIISDMRETPSLIIRSSISGGIHGFVQGNPLWQ